MVIVGVEEIQRDLLAYLHRVEAGESFVILQQGRPIAEIKPPVPAAGQPRPIGLCEGEFSVPEGFDAPLPEDVIRQFEGL